MGFIYYGPNPTRSEIFWSRPAVHVYNCHLYIRVVKCIFQYSLDIV